MTRGKIFLAGMLIVALSFFIVQIVPAEEMKSGEINWVQGYITAIGNGTADPSGNKVKDKLKSLRAAELVAQRTLLETLKGVRIDSTTTVENLMLKEDIINSRVEGVIRGAMIVRRDIKWEEGVPLATVEIRICLSGKVGGCGVSSSLITALNIGDISEPSYVPPERITSSNAPLLPPPETLKKRIAYDASKPVTGVIFSLEGRPFERQLLPVIITIGGENRQLTVYSVKNVTPKVIRSYGVVRYADNEEQARKNPYIGDNIVVIPVENVTKENMIVIGADAVRVIRESTMHGNDYLGDAKVLISSN
jgi:hypothetical protein